MSRDNLPIHLPNIYWTPTLYWFLSKKVIFPKICFLNYNTSLEFQSLQILGEHGGGRKSTNSFLFSSNKCIPLAKTGYFLSLHFSSSTLILLSRTSPPHHIYLCQALPLLNLTFSSTEIFWNNPPPKLLFHLYMLWILVTAPIFSPYLCY